MTPTRQTECPNCRQAAGGNFCSRCGTSLGQTTCPACDRQLTAGTKFCRHCGHQLGSSRQATSSVPWAIAAAAAVVLLLGALVTMGPLGPGPRSASQPSQALPPPAFASTPQGEADKYFDQAMRAHESGDVAQAQFAGQLALSAYGTLPNLSADQRFHLGLLHQIADDQAAILAQADSIESVEPSHLLARLLRSSVHEQANDSEALMTVYRDFLALYDAEIATAKQEYRAHGRLIEAFRNEAIQAVGGAPVRE